MYLILWLNGAMDIELLLSIVLSNHFSTVVNNYHNYFSSEITKQVIGFLSCLSVKRFSENLFKEPFPSIIMICIVSNTNHYNI